MPTIGAFDQEIGTFDLVCSVQESVCSVRLARIVEARRRHLIPQSGEAEEKHKCRQRRRGENLKDAGRLEV